MIINVVDVWDPHYGRSTNLITGGKTIRLGGMSNGVSAMVGSIVRYCVAQNGKISRLRLFGHGTEGVMGVSIGEGSVPSYDPSIRSSIDLTNFDLIKSDLVKLNAFFQTDAVVELFGCSTGGGADGHKLLRKLADLWQVEVKAGALVQYFGTKDTQTVFEGPVISAKPGKDPESDRQPMQMRQILYHLKQGEIQKVLNLIGPF